MKQSRYVWILVIASLCFVGMVCWFTPERIIGVMANPHHGITPRDTVQHFWNLMDTRQIDLAQELIDESVAQNQKVFGKWKHTLENNPLLSLQKLEFMESQENDAVIVKVLWSSSLKEEIHELYLFKLTPSNNNWIIQSIEQLDNLSIGVI